MVSNYKEIIYYWQEKIYFILLRIIIKKGSINNLK